MARADLIILLIKAAMRQNTSEVLKISEGIIAEEHSKNHLVLAKRLTEVIRSAGEQPKNGRLLSNGFAQLLNERIPERNFSDIYLSLQNKKLLDDLKEEYLRRDLLRSYGLSPRNRIMLLGAPGNGKTSLAEVLAYELMLPLVTVRYDGLIGSFLGETASRLNKVFEFARERPCLLFFDEFDTIGKERGDRNETGEIKRIVSSLLLQIDALPSRTVIVVASNHASLLDSAAWRRFQVRIELAAPTVKETQKYLVDYEQKTNLKFGQALNKIATELKSTSYAELEEFSRDVLRKAILTKQTDNAKTITKQKLAQWASRDSLKQSSQEQNG